MRPDELMMPEDDQTPPPAKRWADLAARLATPIVVGLLIAWAGYVSERTLGSISSREERARLVTELQVKREEAETALRKDVFEYALQALLQPVDRVGGVQDLSKQMLRLELLALNFGDSLSLSPLFNEFKRDIDSAQANASAAAMERVEKLNRRLVSLAKRVASTQVSSLAQHGASIRMKIPVPALTPDASGCENYYSDHGYKWPADSIRQDLGYQRDDKSDSEMIAESLAYRTADLPPKGVISLAGRLRRIELMVTEINHCSKSATINLSIWPVNGIGQPHVRAEVSDRLEIEREFRLDFFNFPMVDNTRLEHNQRFALLMEDFVVNETESSIDMVAVLFPAEYASMRDRPGMEEVIGLLHSALERQPD